MVMPRFVTVNDLGEPVFSSGRDLLQFHLMACDIGTQHLVGEGFAPRMWFIADGNSIVTVSTEWDNDTEQKLSVLFIRHVLEATNSPAYSFVSEVDRRLYVITAARKGATYQSRFDFIKRDGFMVVGPRVSVDNHHPEEWDLFSMKGDTSGNTH
jgi:hypothetical protein